MATFNVKVQIHTSDFSILWSDTIVWHRKAFVSSICLNTQYTSDLIIDPIRLFVPYISLKIHIPTEIRSGVWVGNSAKTITIWLLLKAGSAYSGWHIHSICPYDCSLDVGPRWLSSEKSDPSVEERPLLFIWWM